MAVNVPWTDTNTQDGNDNQKVKTGSVTFGANDVVEFVAGSNVSISGDATNKKITISATDTNTHDGNDNQTIKGNGTAFGINDAINIVGSGATTVTADTTNKKITISSSDTHNSHAVISGVKADGSTQIKGSASSGDITLGDSGVTAGEYGPTSNQTPAYGATFNVPDIKVNSKGIVTSVTNRTVKIPASDNSDTKNTAGSTNTSSKIFLVGATSQAANPQTYSHDTAYVDTDGCLYSGGSKVLTSHPTISVGTDSTSTQTATHGGTFTAVDSVTRDSNGHVTKINTKTVTLPSDANVTQTPTTSNASYPLLLAPSNQTTATTTTSYFDSGVTLNPSTNTITSNITGSAKSLLSTDFYSAEGSSGYIKFATLPYNSWRQFNAVFLLQNQYNSEYSSSLVKICGSYGNTSIVKFDFEIIGGDDVSDKLFYYKDGESYTFYVKKNNYSHWYLTRLSNVGNVIVFDGYSTLLTTATTTGTAKYNVSASKLATERTIALSGAATGTATSFDGTKNISIPVTSIKEAYLTWGGKNFAGGWGPIDAAMVPNFAANRFAFLPASAITLEYSTDGGSTWTAKNDDEAKKNLFSTSGSFYIGNNSSTGIDKKNYKCRVTITTSGVVYSRLNKFAIRVSTGGSTGCHVKLESRTKANQDAGNNTWVTDVSRAELSGWSGWNIINVPGITTHGNNSAHYSQLRFTFGVDSHASTLTNPGLQILCIMAFGGEGWTTCSNMAKDGHLYSYDSSQNATFPASVTATNFIGTLEGNAATATSATNATSANKVAKAVTFNNGGSGVASGTTFDGSTARTVSYNTIGAAPTSHASSATTYGVSTASNYGHAKASATSPKAPGTAAVGSETSSFARGDHVHPAQTVVQIITWGEND